MATCAFTEQRITNMLPEDATGDGMVKRLVPLVRKEGWSHEQFIQHWVNIHAELLKKISPAPRRYCQLYVDAEIPPPDGIAAHRRPYRWLFGIVVRRRRGDECSQPDAGRKSTCCGQPNLSLAVEALLLRRGRISVGRRREMQLPKRTDLQEE